ncbi:MAG: alpha-galactosidase [Clostridia bacterium]|nr:alpha-galactosidase [Clostridia bacterium]
MSKKSLALLRAKKEFEAFILSPESFPASFSYGGKTYNGFGDLELIEKDVTDTDTGVDFTMKFALDKNIAISVKGKYCSEFGEYEYTIYFENVGDSASDVISDLYCLDKAFNGENGALRGILGDHENFYKGYEKDLSAEEVYFKSENGRATHIVFPYFDLVHGDGGSLIALGWAGTWDAKFLSDGKSVSLRARSCLNLSTVLLPGEIIRSALVVIIPYLGRDQFNATNLWREWFMKYNLPKANLKGEDLKPFTTVFWANDTGLPNSDGSISERSFTWRPTFKKMLEKNIHPDFRWFDAGWYFDPSGNTVESDWWGTIGTWDLDTVKWPDGSFRESVDACHEVGIKTFVWFEPERVTHVEDLAKNYGYNPEWGITTGNVTTNNIGDDECLEWTFGRISKMLGENNVDLFREDNNSNPAGSWALIDERENQKHALPRNGIGENKAICGHYKLWDKILTFCGENGKCTFLDSCASGGGRNDIESMRRGIPFMRSDFDRTSSAMRLSQTSSFCKWVPFHGSSTKETVHQLEAEAGRGTSPYVWRASFLPVMNYGLQFVQNPDIDYELFHKNLNEWHDIKHLLTKDLYVLTPWHHHEDKSAWTVLAYDDSEIGESILLGFRMEDSADDSFVAKLPFANEGSKYVLTNVDTLEEIELDADALRSGITLKLNEPKSSVLIKIKRK